jgi:hypothetical protein
MLTQGLAHDVEAARKGCIAEGPSRLIVPFGADRRGQRLFRALASAAAREAIDSLERCMAGLHVHHLEADRAGFGALGPNAVAECLLGVLRHQPLELGFRLFVVEEG